MPPPTSPNFPDDSTGPVHVESQYGEDVPPSIAIVRSIAVIEDVDPIDSPTDLGLTLHDHVDLEALDQLVSGATTSTSITVDFTVDSDQQYAVQIRDSGALIVEKDV